MPLARDIVGRVLESAPGAKAYLIVETLTEAGYEAWWVGGAVRDMFLGILPKDIDIATSARPEQVAAVFPKTDLTDAALGASRVRVGTHLFELTTFRLDDTASDGRHPESVVFGTREQDAVRRDFTVNALYWQPISGDLFDPTSGEADLQERLVRFIGEPSVRIRHDALRLLRAIRLRATIAGQYEPATYAALKEESKQLEHLSGSRVFQELEKCLLCPNPALALRDWAEVDALQTLLPEVSICRGIPQPRDYHREGDVLEHILQCVGAFQAEEGIDVRLAAFFHDIGKAETFKLEERIRFDGHASVSADLADAILSRLQCPARRREKIVWLIRHHMHMSFLELSAERKTHWYFHPWFPELIELFRLDIAGTTPADFELYDRIVHDRNIFLDAHPRPEKPYLSGTEIMDLLGLRPGEEIGRLSRELLLAQTEKKVNSKKEAVAFLKALSSSAQA